MFPEAGGSSLFVRRAFNELWSFFTAWAQMLNYVITIAISAFFAARYFGGVTDEYFSTAPGDILLGIGLIAVLALVNVRGVEDAVAVNIVLAVVDFLSQLALVVAGVFLVFSPDLLLRQPVVLRHRADVAGLPDRDPGRHGRLHRDRDDLEHGGRGARPGARRSRRDQARDDRRLHDLLHAAVDRAVGAAGALRRRGENCTTLLGVAKEDGGFASNPMLGIVQAMELGSLQVAAELYVGILAVTILVAATNAGVLGVSRLVYSMGLHRQMPDAMRRLHPRFRTPYLGILVFSGFACVAIAPGQAEFLGAIYAFGAMLSFSMAHLAVLRLRVTQPDFRARTAARPRPRPRARPAAVRARGPRRARACRCSS